MMSLLSKLQAKFRLLDVMDLRIQKIQQALGRIESRQLAQDHADGLQQSEFQVYSQWGEDGIIQKLLRHIKIEKKIFIEFGVENYTESNTRYLLINNSWSGLVIDSNPDHIDYIKKDRIYWQYNLKAECSFITRDNINSLFENNGVSGEIGVLSVDIDGNDYWVWEAIGSVDPAIVIIEYNAKFGPDRAVTIPYREDFVRNRAHYSMAYWGASLNAFCKLANKKGYAFVGCNSAGNNAFFVKRNLMTSELKELSSSEGYVRSMFRESRNAAGKLAFMSFEEEQENLLSLPLIDV